MSIDDKAVKGRGSTDQVANRFLKRSYTILHPEGVDEVEVSTSATKFIETFPRTILNRVESPDLPFLWSLNPYQGCEHGCSYCYARPTHEYWGYGPGLDFERVVLVKRNAAQLLDKALRHRAWKAETISLSGVTDPYQPRERVEQLTRELLKTCLDFNQPVSIITKNALILRDLDLIEALAERQLVQVAVSLTTLNEDLRRVLEPRTSTGLNRLKVMAVLSEAGAPVMAMIAPVIPALNEPEIPALLKAAFEVGALSAGYTVLRTNGAVAPIFEQWLHQHFPDRAAKVLAQTSQLHGGSVQDVVRGRRMKGEGPHALAIGRLFRIMRERYFKGRQMPEMDRTAFKVPPQGQLDMFT